MGDELSADDPQPPRSFTEIFNEHFPFYLSIGMSSAEYWEGDPSLPRAFRKAYQLQQEYENNQAWLKGLYVYDAVSSALTHLSPNKKNHKNYAEKPYSLDPAAANAHEEAKVEEAQARAEVWMRSWAAATQKQFQS